MIFVKDLKTHYLFQSSLTKIIEEKMKTRWKKDSAFKPLPGKYIY